MREEIYDAFFVSNVEELGDDCCQFQYHTYTVRIARKYGPSTQIMIYATPASYDTQDIQTLFVTMKQQYPDYKVCYNNNTFSATIASHPSFIELKTIADQVIDFFTLYGYQPCNTPQAENAGSATANSFQTTATSVNTFATNTTMSSDYSTPARPKENVFLGIIGAIIGAIPGVLLWILIGQLGRVAVICGVAIAIGALYGYAFLGKNISKTGLIVCGIVVLVATFVGIQFDYYLTFMRVYELTLPEAMYVMQYALAEDASFRGSYIVNLVLGYLCSIVGSAAGVSKFL